MQLSVRLSHGLMGGNVPQAELQLDIPFDSRQDAPMTPFLQLR
jgi:hypothetical protein